MSSTVQLRYDTGGGQVVIDLSTPPGTEQVCAVLQELLNKPDVVEIDLSQLGNKSTSGHEMDWDLVSSNIVPLLLGEKLDRVLLNSKVYHLLIGKCRGKVLDMLRETFGGDRVTVSGRTFRLGDLIRDDFLCDKLVVDSGALPPTVSAAISVLNGLYTIKNPPISLVRSVVKAHKCIAKKRRKKRVRRVADHTSRTVKKSHTLADDSSDSFGDSRPEYPPSDRMTTAEMMPGTSRGSPQSPPHEYMEYELESKRAPNQKCYICKQRCSLPPPSSEIQMKAACEQYPRLCPGCALFNFKKRHQRAVLEARYAVVTGGRIKIGYELVLKLLRDGARVIVTTRFPHDAAKRYALEKDSDVWAHRLKIYPLDLKDVTGIHKFVNYVRRTVPYLDILVNNAAQTIRRPVQFYRHLLDFEYIPRQHLKKAEQDILAVDEKLNYGVEKYCPEAVRGEPPVKIPRIEIPDPAAGVSDISRTVEHTPQPLQTQLEVDAEQGCSSGATEDRLHATCTNDSDNLTVQTATTSTANQLEVPTTSPAVAPLSSLCDHLEYFPLGMLDTDGQQVDLRPTNSWRAVLDNVPLGELLEVLVVNTVAPFILTKELKGMFTKSPFRRRFMVNVSAMEGQFNRKSKNEFHPHTNMAKAALNMMTRTAALSYREEGIYMTCVDTGWVTDERPFHLAQKEQKKKGFVLPLDSVDGASRVYDPIVMGLDETKQPQSAVFLKDYAAFPW